LAALVRNELGPGPVDELERAGCQLLIDDTTGSYECTNTTPELEEKIKGKRLQALRELVMRPV